MEKILFEYYDLNQAYAIESAWAERIGNDYKLENILFYAPEYSWGDVVSVENRNGELYVTGLVEESGHSTIRIVFYNKETIQPTIDWLQSMGCDYEGSNIPSLISVDIPPEVDYKIIQQYLKDGETKEIWSFEEACIAHND